MIRNYLLIAIRNLQRQKVHSFINIIGLAVGMAASIMIMLWVQDELSFDRFHTHHNSLYRLVAEANFDGEPVYYPVSSAPMAGHIKEEVPAIVASSRFDVGYRALFTVNGKTFDEPHGGLVDAPFLEMFTFPMLQGDAATALKEPHSIVLSESMAQKYFQDEEPIGKTIRINNSQDFVVTGIIENIPQNSHFKFTYLMPFMYLQETGRVLEDNWGDYNYITYFQLAPSAEQNQVEAHINAALAKPFEGDEHKAVFSIQPVADIHLKSGHMIVDDGGGGDLRTVYIFSVIAVFILLIACINFMNLATARSSKRAKEVGLRKVVGASRAQLIGQFLGESVLLSLIALVLGLILVHLGLPLYNDISGKELTFSVFTPGLTLGFMGVAVLTGLLAGSYPALLLSSFQPVKVLKGVLLKGTGAANFRKALVVLQFSLSALLIIGTLVMYGQLNYMRNKKLGLDKENIVAVNIRGNIFRAYKNVKAELLNQPGVLSVTSVSQDVNNISSTTTGAEWTGKPAGTNFMLNQLSVDHDFISTFQIEVAQGRSFDKNLASDSTAFMINEEAVRQMGLEDPIGTRLSVHGVSGTIVGVTHDFHFKGMQDKISPLLLFVAPDWRSRLYVRVRSENLQQSIAAIEKVWKSFEPAYPFEYSFLDENFDQMYRTEQRAGKLFTYFAIVAILISCLGLFGLAAYTAEQRTKEIGIRKVLGASTTGIAILLSKEYTRLVLVALVIASPLAWYLMNKWLDNFAYRINISWWIFAVAALLALLIALLTVSYQSVKAALANPVHSLRSE
jgi:putative ABC transport system permease protein